MRMTSSPAMESGGGHGEGGLHVSLSQKPSGLRAEGPNNQEHVNTSAHEKPANMWQASSLIMQFYQAACFFADLLDPESDSMTLASALQVLSAKAVSFSSAADS